MKIEWREVTTLSQIVAIVLFVSVFGVGFLVGRKFENKMVLGEPIASAKFVCADKSFISAKFYDRLVFFTYSNLKLKNIYLPQTISASGARYASKDGSLVFWNKGDSVFIEQDGKVAVSDCVANPAK